MSKSLYELTEEFIGLYDAEELDDAQLQTLSLAIKSKTENVVKFLRSVESNAKAIDDEIKALQEKKKSDQRKVEQLKNLIKYSMEQLGLTRLQAGVFTLSIQNNSRPSVVVAIPAEQLPKIYQKQPPVEPDKTKLLDDYIASGVLPEGVVIETGKHLRIK